MHVCCFCFPKGNYLFNLFSGFHTELREQKVFILSRWYRYTTNTNIDTINIWIKAESSHSALCCTITVLFLDNSDWKFWHNLLVFLPALCTGRQYVQLFQPEASSLRSLLVPVACPLSTSLRVLLTTDNHPEKPLFFFKKHKDLCCPVLSVIHQPLPSAPASLRSPQLRASLGKI